MLFFIVIETIADEQQWVFQTNKYEYIRRRALEGSEYERGFLVKGLFK